MRTVLGIGRAFACLEGGHSPSDAPDEVGAGIAESVGDNAGRGEVIFAGYYGELFDETVAVRIALTGISIGDVETPLMVRGVCVLC